MQSDAHGTFQPPTVSVIVIAFQAEHLLAEAIDGVLAQSCADCEILIADDGSTDGTRNIAEAYAVTYPERVRLLRHPDRGHHGAGATRNLALGHAQGDQVTFLDAHLELSWSATAGRH